MEDMMTKELLLQYLSSFPKQLLWAVLIYFLPVQKKKHWYLYLPVPWGLLTAAVALGTALYPAWMTVGLSSQIYFALHYCTVFGAYICGLHLIGKISWQEASYCVICAYMAEHLRYCINTILEHFLHSPSWLNAWYVDYLISIIFYGIIYFMFVRKLCKDGHYLISALRSFHLFVISMAIMFFLSIYMLSLELSWIHAIYTYVFISVLMIHEMQNSMRLQLQEEILAKEKIWALNESQYEMSKENIEIINRKSHDLKRQIAALRTVSTPEEQSAAISEIEQAVQIYDKTFQTGNRAVDTILMQEALKCSQNHIELSAVVNGELLRFIKSVDIYTMLSNILDNAIEANLRISEESARSIHLSVHEKKGLIILQCENPYDGTVVLQDGLPLTSKADKSAHGFGTKSIQAIAEKYGGLLRVNPDHHMYVLRIIFTNRDEISYTKDKNKPN